MDQRVDHLRETASQTAGPYVHIGLLPDRIGLGPARPGFSHVLAGPAAQGERIRIEGYVFDGTGTPVRDAVLEIWQANAQGRYDHPADRSGAPLDPHFHGWGRTGTDVETGLWTFETVKPGVVPGRLGQPMAPHVSLWIVARGINLGLHTRMYFADEAVANAVDPVLLAIEQEVRRRTLVAPRQEVDGRVVYRFDIHLQGPHETVFLDV